MTQNFLDELLMGTEENALTVITTFMYLLDKSKGRIVPFSEYVKEKGDIHNIDCIVYDDVNSCGGRKNRVISYIAVDDDSNYLVNGYLDELFMNMTINIHKIDPDDAYVKGATFELIFWTDTDFSVSIQNGKIVPDFWHQYTSVLKKDMYDGEFKRRDWRDKEIK